MTEEEEKEKFDKELNGLARKGDIVKTKAQIKDAKESLNKLEEEERLTGDPQSQKKAQLQKMIPALEEK